MSRTGKQWEKIYLHWKKHNGGDATPKEWRQSLVRACKGKIAHPNFWSAYLAIRRMKFNDAKKTKTINIYFCQICGSQHIGNNRSPRG